MRKMTHWMLAAILTICGIAMVSCFSDTKKSAAVSATDDACISYPEHKQLRQIVKFVKCQMRGVCAGNGEAEKKMMKH
jgi:hypothetical protein